MGDFVRAYLEEMRTIAQRLLDEHTETIERMLEILAEVRARGGRVFFVGVGGGAGTGSHAANDFMKIGGLSTICLADNVSLLTALTNDEGWESVFVRQMAMHRFGPSDCLFVFSVGGGSATTSVNLVRAIDYAKECSAPVLGVVGKATGHAAKVGDAVLVIPTVAEERITPHAESWQLVLDHLLVNALARIPVEAPVVAEVRATMKG